MGVSSEPCGGIFQFIAFVVDAGSVHLVEHG